jgi:pimeloyl-ACP methyl ester carboxylesterase
MSHTEHRYHSHDSLSLFYRDYPPGDRASGDDVVICLPGLTRNSLDFEPIALRLAAAGWRVLTPDLRGRGRSEPDPNWKQYLPPTYVQDTWNLLDGLGIRRVAVIGTSLGGLMAMIMADQQPERLRGVILNDVGPEITPESIERILGYVGRTPPQPDFDSAVRAFADAYAIAYPDVEEDFWHEQVRRTWRQTEDDQWVPHYDPKIGDALRHAVQSADAVRELLEQGTRRREGLNLDPWDNFRAMAMPTLLLRGVLSDVLSPAIVARMREIKPELEVVEIPNRGHVPMLDEPESLAAIDAFMARLKSA